MAGAPPTLYFDLGSPYGYLAAERAESVLGVRPVFEPVLLGAIFQWRGWGSWALTDARSERVSELEGRARRHGLPPFVWPEVWPANGLLAMRAATWAQTQGRTAEFGLAVYRRQFTRGADITDPQVLQACATEVGLDPEAMLAATGTAEIKEALKQATSRAWEAGVRGIPSVRVGQQIFYGDDQLEAAGKA